MVITCPTPNFNDSRKFSSTDEQSLGGYGYIRYQRWLRLLLVVLLVCGFAYWLYQQGHQTLGIIVVSVLAGRVLRDLVWYRALLKHWHSTDEFIDWSKVERIAAGEEAEPPGRPPHSIP